LTGLREDDAVVSYIGRFAPAVAVPLASSKGGEPATELTLIALEHHERGRYSSDYRARLARVVPARPRWCIEEVK
jgi:hypothetical protein